MVVKLRAGPPEPETVEPADAAAPEDGLAAVLAELEATRAGVKAEINARLLWMVPLGVLGALAMWFYHHSRFEILPGDIFPVLFFCTITGVISYFRAVQAPGDAYRRRYKNEVLPRLAARFGDLTYRPAVTPDLRRLRAEGIFSAFNHVTAEDEITGSYRGLAVSIVELELQQRHEKSTKEIFDGLHCAIELPRGLSGVTAVVPDKGIFGNFAISLLRLGRGRVALEDPRFEAVFEVYGSDQIAARALLTPAFMERFAALGDLPGFSKPLALAVENRLEILLAKRGSANLFEPPSYRHPATSRAALAALHADIAAVLGVADAVIGLDHATRRVAADWDGADAKRGGGADDSA